MSSSPECITEVEKDNSDEKLERLCPSFVDRYFAKGYKVNLPKSGKLADFETQKSNFNDVCVLRHSNRICVITLAPTHPVIANKETVKVSSVSFKVTEKLDRSKNAVSGKRKRGAQWLNDTAPLCIITCSDGKTYTVHCGIRGSLVEMNDLLLTKPELLTDFTQTNGYIAIVMPKLAEAHSTMGGLLNEEEYLKYKEFQSALAESSIKQATEGDQLKDAASEAVISSETPQKNIETKS